MSILREPLTSQFEKYEPLIRDFDELVVHSCAQRVFCGQSCAWFANSMAIRKPNNTHRKMNDLPFPH